MQALQGVLARHISSLLSSLSDTPPALPRREEEEGRDGEREGGGVGRGGPVTSSWPESLFALLENQAQVDPSLFPALVPSLGSAFVPSLVPALGASPTAHLFHPSPSLPPSLLLSPLFSDCQSLRTAVELSPSSFPPWRGSEPRSGKLL
jgi:hypothetical protein